MEKVHNNVLNLARIPRRRRISRSKGRELISALWLTTAL
jgi:hypothetical protein